MTTNREIRLVGGCALLCVLASCGGGGDSAPVNPPPPTPATYTIGGSITGLIGSVTLQNNGGDSLTLTSNGNFIFPGRMTSGAAYTVTVSSQPLGPDCVTANGSGTANANVSSVSVTCTVGPRTYYLPFQGFAPNEFDISNGIYVLSTKAIDRPLVKVTSTNLEPIGIVPKLTVQAGGVVTGARPQMVAYMTNGVSGGDQLWLVDLAGDSTLQPRQISSLRSQPVPANAGVGLCQARTLLKRLDDPSSAFFILVFPTDPLFPCNGGLRRTVLVYAIDTATTPPRELTFQGGNLEPVYRPDGTLAGIVAADATGQGIAFYPDETFTNPRQLVAGPLTFTFFGQEEVSTWTPLAGITTNVAMRTSFVGASIFTVGYTGIATQRFSSLTENSEGARYGNDVFVDERDTSVTPSINRLLRIPLESATAPVTLQSYEEDPDCTLHFPVTANANKLLLVRICFESLQHPRSVKVISIDRAGPSTPVDILTAAQSYYSVTHASETAFLTMADVQSVPSGFPPYRYTSVALTPDGSTLQQPTAASAFIAWAPGVQSEMVQVRNIPGDNFAGGELYSVIGANGVLSTPQRLSRLDGSPYVLPADSYWADFRSLGDGIGIGRIMTTTDDTTNLVYDLTRRVVVPFSVSGTRLVLVDNNGR